MLICVDDDRIETWQCTLAERNIVSRATNISAKDGQSEERAICILTYDWLIFL